MARRMKSPASSTGPGTPTRTAVNAIGVHARVGRASVGDAAGIGNQPPQPSVTRRNEVELSRNESGDSARPSPCCCDQHLPMKCPPAIVMGRVHRAVCTNIRQPHRHRTCRHDCAGSLHSHATSKASAIATR